MKLTNQQILALSEAITQLDGRHVLQVVEGKAVNVFQSHRIAAAARWSLAKCQGVLQLAIADFNRAKDTAINHHSGGKGVLSQQSEKFAEFVSELEALKREEVELTLPSIKLDDLHLEENEKNGHGIPIAVLAALQPLITA